MNTSDLVEIAARNCVKWTQEIWGRDAEKGPMNVGVSVSLGRNPRTEPIRQKTNVGFPAQCSV